MIYGCSVLGAILIVAGLYSVLWGKYRENLEKKQEEEIPEAIKGAQGNGNEMSMIDDIETNDIEMQKAEAKKLSSVAISTPIPETPMKENPDPKA